MNELTTWSPTANDVTPSPTSTISPAPSCPSTSGGGSGMVPLVAERSEWHTPQAASLTVTSPRLGPSTEMVSTTTGLLSSRQIAALPVLAIARSEGIVGASKYSPACATRSAHFARRTRLARRARRRHLARQAPGHRHDHEDREQQRAPQPELLAVHLLEVAAYRSRGRLRGQRRGRHLAQRSRQRLERLVLGRARQERARWQGRRCGVRAAEHELEWRLAARDEEQAVRQPARVQNRHPDAQATAARIDAQQPAPLG